jgi:uncharacterized protein (DUF1499 family)
MTKHAWWLAGAGVVVLAAVAALATRWPNINDVTTGGTPEYPDLQPGWYPRGPEAVFHVVQAVAGSMPGWRIISQDPEAGVLHAEARVLLTPFTDDVTIRVERVEGGSRVHVRSRSRVGRGDLGVNARRIRAFQRVLDRELSSGASPPE